MAWILWVVFFVGHARADVPTVTLEEAVASARERATNVRIAQAQENAAEAKVGQTRAGQLPTVGVSGNALVYTGPYEVEFPGLGAFTVREQFTWGVAANATEPLTGQVAIARQAEAAELSAAASAAAVDGALADSELAVEDLWYQALQAERQLAIAEAQVTGLESRVGIAQVSFAAGNLTESDRLLAEVALAQARQAVIQNLGAA